MDLSTTYMGLKLKNPVVGASSPISKHIDQAKRLEDAGASAIVMYSLFASHRPSVYLSAKFLPSRLTKTSRSAPSNDVLTFWKHCRL